MFTEPNIGTGKRARGHQLPSGLQPLPNCVTLELPVIRPQSRSGSQSRLLAPNRSLNGTIVALALRLHVAHTTRVCCNSNMEVPMSEILEALFHRRAGEAVESVEHPPATPEKTPGTARHQSSLF